LEEDASRRDFTVNALFENLHTGTLIDPTGRGLEDLRARVLRTPKDPNKTFYDDPLRMLRAVRFRWQFEFEPAENLYPAVQQNASRLSVISAERYRDEFNKILLLPLASKALADLMNLGLFDQLIPELMAMKGVDQGNFHHLDVWNHSLLVVENLKNTPDLLLKLAGLFHDVGKPATRSVDESGKIRFFNHEVIGEELTQSILRRLKYSGDEIATVARLVRNHMRLGSAPVFTSSAARRVWRDMGDDVPRLLALVDADSHALKPGVRSFDLGPIEAQLEQVKRVTPVSDLESPLTGQEIMSILELAPGPEIGRAKKFLLEHVLEGSLKIGDRKESERLLREDYHRERQTKDWQA
jgi:poly(A) polymerase